MTKKYLQDYYPSHGVSAKHVPVCSYASMSARLPIVHHPAKPPVNQPDSRCNNNTFQIKSWSRAENIFIYPDLTYTITESEHPSIDDICVAMKPNNGLQKVRLGSTDF